MGVLTYNGHGNRHAVRLQVVLDCRQAGLRTRRLANVRTEMNLHVLAYNLKRAVSVVGTPALVTATRG
jgi:hypothetical protein